LAPALVVACAVVAAYSAFNWQGLIVERVASIVDVYEDTSNVFRIMDTLNALITFSRHPILGIGSGGQYDFEFYSEAVAPSVFWENASRACHNGYLYILFKMGIVGFLAYITIFYKFVRRWIKLRRNKLPGSDQIVYYALGTGIVAILVNNLTSPVADSLRPALLLAVLMACVSVVMPSQDSTEVHPA
jgi:O-antigen ligase